MYRQCGVFWHCTGNEAYSVIYIYIYIYMYVLTTLPVHLVLKKPILPVHPY